MNNEIKEILDKLGKKSSIYKFQINQGTSFNTDEYEASILLDYITNLQEENERLNKGLEYAKRIEKDYKTKFDKAIEFIEEELSFNVIINGKENKVIEYNKAFENIRNILESSDEQ